LVERRSSQYGEAKAYSEESRPALKLRLFLDANILFTAAYSPEGLSALLFELCQRRVLELLTSQQALEEARLNLRLKRPEASNRLEKFLKLLEVVEPPSNCPVALDLPDDDLAVFGAALGGRSTHLITGDKKHFGRYFDRPDQTAGIRIQTARRFFDDRF